MSSNWQPGDRAVCVDDRWHEEEFYYLNCDTKLPTGLRAGNEYTVIEVMEDFAFWADDITPIGHETEISLRLLEARCPSDDGFYEAARFRKLPPLISQEETESICELKERV